MFRILVIIKSNTRAPPRLGLAANLSMISVVSVQKGSYSKREEFTTRGAGVVDGDGGHICSF